MNRTANSITSKNKRWARNTPNKMASAVHIHNNGRCDSLHLKLEEMGVPVNKSSNVAQQIKSIDNRRQYDKEYKKSSEVKARAAQSRKNAKADYSTKSSRPYESDYDKFKGDKLPAKVSVVSQQTPSKSKSHDGETSRKVRLNIGGKKYVHPSRASNPRLPITKLGFEPQPIQTFS